MIRKLRDYQVEGIADLRQRFAAGAVRVPMVLATGLGKTEMFTDPSLLDDYLDAGKRILIIAHTDELISQAAKTARRNNPGRRVGIVKGQRYNEVHAHIIVSSRQTLQSEARRRAIRNVGLIIVDEAHHALRSNTYGKILEHFGAFIDQDQGLSGKASNVHVAGFTATLARGDKGKLSTVWQELTFSRDILFGIRRGYLLDVVGNRIVVPELDMSRVRQSAGDYRDSDMAEELERTFAPEIIARDYLRIAGDRKGIAFWPLVETAEHGAEAFNAAGIPSGVIHGKLPTEERRLLLKRLHSGDVQVVHGVGVLTEGFDEPTVDVVVVARPTRSAPLYQQMVGRVLRPNLELPPAERGKALILDVVGAGAKHDLRSLVDLSPERPLYRPEEQEELSLLELDEWVEEDLAEKRAGATFEFEGDVYAGDTEVREFDPLGRSQLWQRTPGGSWYMGAGGDAYCFLVDSLTGDPGTYDVVLCSKSGPGMPQWLRRGKQEWARQTEHLELPLDLALGLAEETAMAVGGHGSKTLTGRTSKWRKGEPSERQVRMARAVSVVPTREDGQAMNAGELSAAIDARLAQWRIDPLVRAVTGSK